MRGKQGKGFIERVWGGSDMQGSGGFGGFGGIWEVSSEHISPQTRLLMMVNQWQRSLHSADALVTEPGTLASLS